MSDTVPPKRQRDGEVDCTARLATVGLGRPLRPGATWLRAELAVFGYTAASWAQQILVTRTSRPRTIRPAAYAATATDPTKERHHALAL
jgi:hypothetical protein